jgi:hypothetical protein
MTATKTGLFKPSLVRRLVLAHLLTTSLIWLAVWLLAMFQAISDVGHADSEQMQIGAALTMHLARSLDGNASALHESVQLVDSFQRSVIGPSEATKDLQLPRIYLWHHNQLVGSLEFQVGCPA